MALSSSTEDVLTSSQGIEAHITPLLRFDFQCGVIHILNYEELARVYSILVQKDVLDDACKDMRRRIGALLVCVNTDTRTDWGFFMHVRMDPS